MRIAKRRIHRKQFTVHWTQVLYRDSGCKRHIMATIPTRRGYYSISSCTSFVWLFLSLPILYFSVSFSHRSSLSIRVVSSSHNLPSLPRQSLFLGSHKRTGLEDPPAWWVIVVRLTPGSLSCPQSETSSRHIEGKTTFSKLAVWQFVAHTGC